MERFEDMFSLERLFASWNVFRQGKKLKADVSDFASGLVSNLSVLHRELHSGIYKHGGYKYFKISDPKPRDIHKASVTDRVLHHAIYRSFYPYFDKLFIHDSYSCRMDKGTHRALGHFDKFVRQAGNDKHHTVWVLKCDIRKCFASIDHCILKNILKKHIKCQKILKVVEEVIDSFNPSNSHKGIPLGNLTSQLFVNIYLNELDQFIKRELKVRHYIRYSDDFVLMSTSKALLVEMLPKIEEFLSGKLNLSLPPNKVSVGTVASGVDFLGWTHFQNHRVLRTTTKRRMAENLDNDPSPESRASYVGLLKWGNAYKLKEKVINTSRY